jgi:type II secretory pathway pseudopilin PulG
MSEILGTMFKYLVQLLGVAAVVGILYSVFASNKTGDAVSDTTQLQTNIQALYSGQPSFSSLNNTVAITGKLAPKNMISGTTLVNPWSGAVTVGPNSNTARFDVSHAASIPKESCAKLIQSQSSAVVLTVNGTAVNLPVDAGTAVANCNVDANAVVFTYAH